MSHYNRSKENQPSIIEEELQADVNWQTGEGEKAHQILCIAMYDAPEWYIAD